jgi:hypothetical protein
MEVYQCGECTDNNEMVPKRFDKFFERKKLFLILGAVITGVLLAGGIP